MPANQAAAKGSGHAQHREHIAIPLSLYWLKDMLREFVSHGNFPDSLLSVFAMVSVAIAFPLYPVIVLIPLLIITFALARLHPLIGLMALLFITLPMYAYQAPLLAWLFSVLVSVSLIFGYRHYRTITFVYAMAVLPFSYLGYFLEVPLLILGTLYIGLKRSAVAAVAIVILVSMLAGLTGIQNTAPLVYNMKAFLDSAGKSGALQYLEPSKTAPGLNGFASGFGGAIGSMFSFAVAGHIFDGIFLAGIAVASNAALVLIQAAVWLLLVFSISSYAMRSRSFLKGFESSSAEVLLFVAYAVLSYAERTTFDWRILTGFIVAPALIFMLEFNDVKIVRSLEVMKEDFIGRLGDSFEDIALGARESFDDIGNYDETKREVREAVLAPIEHRELSGAYGIKPAKGILLFGPPGTGKTLLMRAVSNELHAHFFYVKASDILSPRSGESAQALSRVFEASAKSRPSVLFFDEIDEIAGKRESQAGDIGRQLITTLLSEMDGFQKMEGVVVVGSTNVPQLLDPGILRPGRFDKIIYMPLPDHNGRLSIFRHYSKRYPFASDIDYEVLAGATKRFSGADIENACAEAARQVAERAIEQSEALKIETEDIIDMIHAIKPSTSLAQLEAYEKFKVDYGRRLHPEALAEEKMAPGLDDVAGLDDAKKAFYEAVEVPLKHHELAEKYGVKEIKGVLLFGPPGTGKSMLMNAFSESLKGISVFRVEGSGLSREAQGKAVESMKEIFERARENSPSVILIDEIDSLLPDREKGSEEGGMLTGEFFREFDAISSESGVVVVGSTNRPDALDPAVIRPGRFDKLVYAGPPDASARKKIFELNLGGAQVSKDIDAKELAEITDGYTGADIANICRQAKMESVEKAIDTGSDNEIHNQDILRIIHATRPSAPKIVIGRSLAFLSAHGRS